MPLHRGLLAVAVVVLAGATGSCPPSAASTRPSTLAGHPVRLDVDHKLLSWWAGDAPFAHVARLAWWALETKVPVQDNGLETWLAHSRFDPDTFGGVNWPHNPAGLYAMLTDSAVLWYAFSGDRGAVNVVRKALDHQIAHGTTPREWDWARVPYASANAGDVEYRGADDAWCDFCGRGDGTGVIEPDKVGELGFAYMQLFEVTGTFDAEAIDTLELAFRPVTVVSGDVSLAERMDLAEAGYVVRVLPSGDSVVRVRHRSPGEVVVTLRRTR